MLSLLQVSAANPPALLCSNKLLHQIDMSCIINASRYFPILEVFIELRISLAI